MGLLPTLLFLVSFSLRNSPRGLLTPQGQQRRATEELGAAGPPRQPSAAETSRAGACPQRPVPQCQLTLEWLVEVSNPLGRLVGRLGLGCPCEN